nr:SH3 domain-containing protein [Saccharomonospora marina]
MLGIPKKTLVIFAVLIGVVLIYAMGSDQRPSEAQSGSDGEDCRVKVTADILNVRAGPGMAAEIVGKLRQEAETEAQPVVRNGFRKIDDSRWAADAFLEPVSGASCG